MIDTRAERLTGALDDLIRSSPDVEAAAVVSLDGLPLASVLPPGTDEGHLAAMTAALAALGEQAASLLGRGALRQVFVEGPTGFVFVMAAKQQALLATVTSQAATVGYLLFEARRTAAAIGEILEQGEQAADLGMPFDGAVPGAVGVPPVGDGSDAFDGEWLGMAPSHR